MYEEIKEIIVNTVNCDEQAISLEALLVEDLEMDSLDSIELGSAIEDELGITIPDEKLSEVKTVGDIVAYVEANQK